MVSEKPSGVIDCADRLDCRTALALTTIDPRCPGFHVWFLQNCWSIPTNTRPAKFGIAATTYPGKLKPGLR
ncbi:MAG: hypothetical protein PHS77_11780, partial [Gallionellaceae bacterium]|nr:hypothetical protein [Gallionellaceae bacterium]